MQTLRHRPDPPPGVGRLSDSFSGSPMLVGILSSILMISIFTVGAVWLRDEGNRARVAADNVGASEDYGVLLDLLAAVQSERGRAEIVSVSTDVEDQEAFLAAVNATDAELDRVEDAGVEADTSASEIAERLSLIRVAVGKEATFELYSDVADLITQILSMNTASTEGAPGIAARRARDSLVAAAEVLAKRRGLVAGLVAQETSEDGEDPDVRLRLLDDDVDTLLTNAATLSLGTDLVGRITTVRRQLSEGGGGAQTSEELAQAGTDSRQLRVWFDEATVDIHEVFGLVDDLNSRERARASEAQADARGAIIVIALLLLCLSVLVMVVGWVGVKAARERNEALKEHEHLAAGVTGWFLPAAIEEVAGVRADAVYVPAGNHVRAGGDWYDLFQLPSGEVAAGIGDVVGHGPQAVSHMSTLRNMMRGLVEPGHAGVSDALSHVDRVAAKIGITATVLYCIWDPMNGRLTYTRAGHPAGILVDPSGRCRLLDEGSDPLIGLSDPVRRTSFTVDASRGSRLVLFTDGIVESRSTPIDDNIDLVARTARSADPEDSLAQRIVDLRPEDDDDGAVLVVDLGAAEVEPAHARLSPLSADVGSTRPDLDS